MDMKRLDVDLPWIESLLIDLLRIPSPSGRTDEVVQFLGEVLESLAVPFDLTRRGALVATLPGRQASPRRALVVHADTIGCMVSGITDAGRLLVTPIGTHSARFAEGARVTIFTDDLDHFYTGTILPLKASGHAYDHEIDTQGVGWDHVEVRVDERISGREDVVARGIQVGDYVALQSLPQVTPTGYVKARHLDGKAAVAALLGAIKALADHDVELPVAAHVLVTISEELGHGASHGVHEDVAEMVSVDIGVVAPGQASSEHAVTVAMKDAHGPFDYHLTRRLQALAARHGVPHRRDVFRYYRSDVAAALEAGAATRAALIGFGVDATHGHERTHLEGIAATAELISLYLQSDLTFGEWDAAPRGPLSEFPSTSVQPARREPGIAAPEVDQA